MASPEPVPLPSDHSFDPGWLVVALRRECLNDALLIAAAERCYLSGTETYVYFVAPDRANQAGAEWQFSHNVVLESTPYGQVVLDVLRDGRIGGIEFLDQV